MAAVLHGSFAQTIPFVSFLGCVLVVLLWKRARRDPAILLLLIGTQGGFEFVRDWVVSGAANLRAILSALQFAIGYWFALALLRERKQGDPKKR